MILKLICASAAEYRTLMTRMALMNAEETNDCNKLICASAAEYRTLMTRMALMNAEKTNDCNK